MIDQMEAALRNQRTEIAAPLQREVDLVRANAARDREEAVARVRDECRRYAVLLLVLLLCLPVPAYA